MVDDADITVVSSRSSRHWLLQLTGQFDAGALHHATVASLRDLDVVVQYTGEVYQRPVVDRRKRQLTVLDHLAIAHHVHRRTGPNHANFDMAFLKVAERAKRRGPEWSAAVLRRVDRLIELAGLVASFQPVIPATAPTVSPTTEGPEVITLTMACGIRRLEIPIVPRLPRTDSGPSRQLALALVA
ncbi:hypothetical protein ACIRRH_31650 [Kitasatospora sp. NPDC101235]|uniref:hypothetical protein n=1 Tax=Kitasatospora sp. NPDC101235 TaxID=3364101 RepID=UPI00382459A8